LSVEVRYKSGGIISIELVVGIEVLNVICVCTSQVELADDIIFREEVEQVMQSLL